MTRIAIHIDLQAGDSTIPLDFDAPDMPTALLVADINMDAGVAEIWQDHRRLARLRKGSRQESPFWEVS